jgi:hypothetical protein
VARDAESGYIVGVMWLQLLGDTRVAFIPYYAVDRIVQGHGVGQRLFAYARERLAQTGEADVILWEIEVPTGDANDPTRRRLHFYEKCGGQVVRFAQCFSVPDMNGTGEYPLWLMVAPIGDYAVVNDLSHALFWADALLRYDVDYCHYPQHRAKVLRRMRQQEYELH